MQKVAVFGGTFNPIHWGHLLIAETALDQRSLDQVIWVPSAQPPHRDRSAVVNITHRVAMIQQASASHPGFTVSSIDQTRPGVSYAIDTYIDLQSIYPNRHWHWIIGLDAFQTLPQWHRRQALISQCCWLVAPRLLPAVDPAALCQQVAQRIADQGYTLDWQLLDMPLVAISSSLIRQYCRDRRSIRYLVPDPVRTYIMQHRFYQEGNDPQSQFTY